MSTSRIHLFARCHVQGNDERKKRRKIMKKTRVHTYPDRHIEILLHQLTPQKKQLVIKTVSNISRYALFSRQLTNSLASFFLIS